MSPQVVPMTDDASQRGASAIPKSSCFPGCSHAPIVPPNLLCSKHDSSLSRLQNEPGGEGGEFFVLGPRGAEGFAESGEEFREHGGLAAKSAGGRGEEFAFFDGGYREMDALAGVEHGFAEEFAVGGVDDGVGGEDFGKFG